MAKDQVLEARFEMHEKQCVIDKQALHTRLDAIDTKLWALIVAVVIQLFAVIGYLVTEGTPWEHPNTIIADRGERK